MMERANEGHGEHRASREAGHGAHWGRGAVELDPDRIDGEVIAGGRVASWVTERDNRFNFFVFYAVQSLRTYVYVICSIRV